MQNVLISDLPLWAVDSEDDSKGKLKMINFYDGKRHTTVYTHEQAVEFILNTIQRGQIWACNCEYDLSNIFGDQMIGAMCEMTYLKSAFVKARMFDLPRGLRIVFYDTLRHWKIGVKTMGDKLGYPKLEFDPDSVEYCRRDTEIVWKWVDFQRKAYESFGAPLNSTIGSSAMKLWKTTYQKHSAQLPINSERPFLSQAVRGGRVEIFRIGPLHGKIECYDINSMYPYVMRDMEFPDLDTMHVTKSPNLEKFGAADLTIEYPARFMPCLPWKADKLLFPTGKMRSVWCYPEIRQALADGARIIKTHKAIEFSKGCRPFKDYIEDLYTLRLEAKDDLTRDTFKNFMNNLFGKYGAKNSLELWRGFSVEERTVQFPEANQIWAAYVTCYARLHLLKFLRRYEKHVLYCDTDSVFLLDGPEVKTSTALGDFKHVGSYGTAHFVLPKVYMLMKGGEKFFKVKGVPQKSARDFFEMHEAEFLSPVRFRESFRRGIKANVWISKTRSLNQVYDKRETLENGLTRPIHLS